MPQHEPEGGLQAGERRNLRLLHTEYLCRQKADLCPETKQQQPQRQGKDLSRPHQPVEAVCMGGGLLQEQARCKKSHSSRQPDEKPDESLPQRQPEQPFVSGGEKSAGESQQGNASEQEMCLAA